MSQPSWVGWRRETEEGYWRSRPTGGTEDHPGGHLHPPQPDGNIPASVHTCPSLFPRSPPVLIRVTWFAAVLRDDHMNGDHEGSNGRGTPPRGQGLPVSPGWQVAEAGLEPRPSVSKSQILFCLHLTPFFEVESPCTVSCPSSMVKTHTVFPGSALENRPG